MTTKPDNAQQILRAYAESCHRRFVDTAKDGDALFAISNPEKWKANCMADAEWGISKGRETWERLAAMLAEREKGTT